MKKVEINGKNYEVIEDCREALDLEVLKEKLTDYFDDYDYVVGDRADGKLRLKGFYDSKNKKCKKINDISGLKDYIENSCAYGCKWFEIRKIND